MTAQTIHDPPGVGGQPPEPDGESVATVALVRLALAEAALRRPAVPVADGWLIYVHMDGWVTDDSKGSATVTGMEYQPRDAWIDPNGMEELKIMAGDDVMLSETEAASEEGGGIRRALLAANGPSLITPTLPWLAGLPTDPAQLLALLRAQAEQNGWSTDWRVFDAVSRLYSECDIALTPAVRAALLRALALTDGLTAGELDIDGATFVTIRHTEGEADKHEIIFDPLTGSAVGRRTLHDETTGSVRAHNGPLFTPPAGYHVTWTQNIVDRVGDRS